MLRSRLTPTQELGAPSLRARRRLVLLAALVALAVKLVMAATTYGTQDVTSWRVFARAVAAVGPVHVYGYHFVHQLYNHPPLVGYLLLAANGLHHLGPSIGFLVRAASSLCDVASAGLVFELVRRRRPLRDATWSGALVALSPVLFTVSGFHGNTDPIFTMFVLLAVWLLVDRERRGAAGAALGVAVSIKLVPVVVVPVLLVVAIRAGRSSCLRFLAGLAAVIVVIWSPAVLLEWSWLRHDVLEYPGIAARPWGIPQLASWMGSRSTGAWLAGPGRVLVVSLSSLLPAILAYRRPELAPQAVALAMAGFFLLSPAFGVQYVVWPMALAYLIDVRAATAYNLLGGSLLVVVYSRWSGGILWDRAHSVPLTLHERELALVVWLALASVVVRGALVLVAARPSVVAPVRRSDVTAAA